MAKKQTAVRNEQTAQDKPDDLHVLMIAMTKDAEHAQGLQDRVLKLAQSYCDKAGVLDVAKFSADCATQEAWITSDAAAKEGVKSSRVPRNWVQTKSNILRAVKPVSENGTGKSLTEFKSMYELRKAIPRKPRQPKGEKAAKPAVSNLDPKISAALDVLVSQVNAMAAISLTLNDKGLEDLEGSIQDLCKQAAAEIEHFKVNAEAYAKEAAIAPGKALDVDEELDDTADVIDEALSTQKPGQAKHH